MDERKRQLRREYRARAASLTPEYRARADRAIRGAVLCSRYWQQARGVFLYVSVGAEPDTRALIAAALAAGKRVYVPRCLADRTMEAVRISDPAALRPGAFGIPEPPETAESAAPGEIGLALVPCVTATEDGVRLGRGAGYYDRFLRRCACPKLCLCYAEMLAPELPSEAHDVPMDAVVTEKGIVS